MGDLWSLACEVCWNHDCPGHTHEEWAAYWAHLVLRILEDLRKEYWFDSMSVRKSQDGRFKNIVEWGKSQSKGKFVVEALMGCVREAQQRGVKYVGYSSWDVVEALRLIHGDKGPDIPEEQAGRLEGILAAWDIWFQENSVVV